MRAAKNITASRAALTHVSLGAQRGYGGDRIHNKFDSKQSRLTHQTIERLNDLNSSYIACSSCDSLWLRPHLEEGEYAKCYRCSTVIIENKKRSLERTVSLMLASLMLYVVSVVFPFMRMERSGLFNEISVIDAIAILADNSMPILAMICAALILVFPLTRIVILLLISSRLMFARSSDRSYGFLYRIAQSLEPWTMAEIFMIGVVVSLIKVGTLAEIYLGPAFWGMSALIIVMALASSANCKHTIWRSIRSDS